MSKYKLNEIKDQIAQEEGWGLWSNICNSVTAVDDMDKMVNEIARRYADFLTKDLYTQSEVEASIKASLEKAARNARAYDGGNEATVLESTITDPSNVVVIK